MTRLNDVPIRLALVGIGKIARDQHLPAIAGDPRFDLVATASRNAGVDGVPGFVDIAQLIAQGPPIDAVSFATPPDGRYDQALTAIDAGLHVMLEKPPTATLSEIADLTTRAAVRGVTLYTSWHSRAAAGVAPARAWLANRRITAIRIDWREDIRRWHPGQDWILEPGGFGVFDPGINALSILTALTDAPVRVRSARIDVPEGRGAPIAAAVEMLAGAVPVAMALDFLQTGPQTWDIAVDTDAGTLHLGMGGSVLTLPGEEPTVAPDREYPGLYARFADLVAGGIGDADARPLALVADAFLLAERRSVAPFAF